MDGHTAVGGPAHRRRLRAGLAAALVALPVIAFAGAERAGAIPIAIDVAVGDSTVVEGNGVQNATATFAVRLSSPAPTDSYVYFHTQDGTAAHKTSAVPDGDFAQKKPGSKVKIAAGKVTGNIGVG